MTNETCWRAREHLSAWMSALARAPQRCPLRRANSEIDARSSHAVHAHSPLLSRCWNADPRRQHRPLRRCGDVRFVCRRDETPQPRLAAALSHRRKHRRFHRGHRDSARPAKAEEGGLILVRCGGAAEYFSLRENFSDSHTTRSHHSLAVYTRYNCTLTLTVTPPAPPR